MDFVDIVETLESRVTDPDIQVAHLKMIAEAALAALKESQSNLDSAVDSLSYTENITEDLALATERAVIGSRLEQLANLV